MDVPYVISKITHRVFQYSYLIFFYFNDDRLSLEFRFIEITCLVDLKFTIENLLCYPDNRRVVTLYYHSSLIDNKENIQLNKFELKMDDDLTIMWSAFYHYETKF